MPFEAYAGDPAKLSDWSQPPPWLPLEIDQVEVLLRQVAPNTFQLCDGFRYVRPDMPSSSPFSLGPYDVPNHDPRREPDDGDNSTDLASVPSWLWWFISSHGRHTRAALLHDHLVDTLPNRSEADDVFLLALSESRVPPVRRSLMWTAVRLKTLSMSRPGVLALLLLFAYIALFVYASGWAIYTQWPDLLGLLDSMGLEWFEPGAWLLGAVAGLWSLITFVMPYYVEEHPWRVTLALSVVGVFFWRVWLSVLAGLAIIGVPTVAVWAAHVLAWLMERIVQLIGHLPGTSITSGDIDFGGATRNSLGSR